MSPSPQPSLADAVSRFGKSAQAKLSNPSASGEPEAWQPQAPTTAKELAEVSARLGRLLREEVAEALKRNSPALTTPAADWRHLLLPSASDADFGDGYAQAVTFGLLMARWRAPAASR